MRLVASCWVDCIFTNTPGVWGSISVQRMIIVKNVSLWIDSYF
nr:MAG TPA: hypothetical protein [Caudoviricetes sp.]